MARQPTITRRLVAAQVIAALASMLGVAVGSLSQNQALPKLGLGSLRALASLGSFLNAWPAFEALGLHLVRGETANLATVGDLVTLVHQHLQRSQPTARRPSGSSALGGGATGRGTSSERTTKRGAPALRAKKKAARKAAKKAAARPPTGSGSGRRGRPPRRSGPVAGLPGETPPIADLLRNLESYISDRPDRGARSEEDAQPLAQREKRYANVELFDANDGLRLDEAKSFAADQIIRVSIDIGELSPESHVQDSDEFPAEFPVNRLPADVDLDVMVTSTDFAVAPESAALTEGHTVAHGQLHLPKDGSPATTPTGAANLVFFLKAPSDVHKAPPDVLASRTVHARIGYYYRNILVQSQRLTGHVGGNNGFTIVTDYTVSADLTGLDQLPARPRISVLTNANDGGGHQIVIRHPGQPPADEDRGGTISIGDGVDHTIAQLREVLTDRAPSQKARSKSQLGEDLKQLAQLGWTLYTQLPGKLPAWTFVDLSKNPDQFVVQVTRPTTSAFVLPWAFVYDIPLISRNKLKVCPLVDKWDERSSLFKEASPRGCPCGPHDQDQDVLCPFGFWGFRYAIEQVSKTDVTEPTITIAAGSRFVVGEAQYNIDPSALTNHVAALTSILRGALPQATLFEGKDRDTIHTLLGDDIPFVYFFCHGQSTDFGDGDTWLAVGNKEPISPSDLVGWTKLWATAGKRVWNKVRPLVFINACHSLAISSKTLVSYLDAFVGNACAAGVIGTEVKVAQTLAMEFAEQFFTHWLSGNETVESALRAARNDFLRQGNLFGLVYTPYCWSELKVVAAKAAA